MLVKYLIYPTYLLFILITNKIASFSNIITLITLIIQFYYFAVNNYIKNMQRLINYQFLPNDIFKSLLCVDSCLYKVKGSYLEIYDLCVDSF
jgi:hypothetical protein